MAQWTEEDAAKLIKAALAAKDQSDAIYREAMELAFPDRENFNKVQEGQEKATKNWDSTTTVSLIRSANRLSTDWTPQFSPFLEIGLGRAAQAMPDEAFKKLTGRTKEIAKAELEGLTAIVQAVLQGPGFPLASNELYLDWHFGQGGMQINDNPEPGEPVIFQSMPMSHFYAYEGANGRHDRWFLWHEERADTVQQTWPDAKIGEELQKKIDASKKEPCTVKLVSVVYRDPDEKDRPFRYEVFYSYKAKVERMVSRQSRTPPFVTPRYMKLPGENRGRGPVLFALPDIRTANKIVEMTLRGVAIAIAGVYTATEDGVIGPVGIKPFSIIRVRSNGGTSGPSLQRLDNPQRIDYGQLVLEQLHDSIKKVIGDTSLPSEAGPIRSATEFVQRARELIQDQAGGLPRLFAEFIIPTVQRVIDILERKQIIATDGLKIDQFIVEVRMISALARQEAMAEVQNVVSFIEMLKSLGGMELAAYEVNMETAPGWIADQMSIPNKLRNTTEQKAKIMKGATQTAAAQMGADPNAAGAALDAEMAAQQ